MQEAAAKAAEVAELRPDAPRALAPRRAGCSATRPARWRGGRDRVESVDSDRLADALDRAVASAVTAGGADRTRCPC